MSEPTKADLERSLRAAEDRANQLQVALNSLDPEAKAINSIVKTLDKLPRAQSRGYMEDRKPDPNAVTRVLDAVAQRFGVRPDYEKVLRIIEQADTTIRLSDGERKELERLRDWAASNPATGQAVW